MAPDGTLPLPIGTNTDTRQRRSNPMSNPNELTPEWIINHLDNLMSKAATGDPDAAADAHRVFGIFLQYLDKGGALPANWAANAIAATVGSSSTTLTADDDDNWYLTVEDHGLGPTIPEPVTVFETEDQFGFNFDEPAPAPAPAQQVTYYPKPEKSKPGTPRRNSAGDTDIPVHVPSTLGHGTFTEGMNNPIESHKVQAKMALRAGKFNHIVFWLIFDTDGGLADHEMERILNRSHQSLSATRNTLMNKGYIIASGEIRKTEYGNDAAVWVPTEWAVARVTRGLEKRQP